jgi:hypothetical protein
VSENKTQETEGVLRDAWQKFADYDMNSIRIQESFRRWQFWILVLGGLVTLLALLHTQLFEVSDIKKLTWLNDGLHYSIIITPILISIMVTASNHFKPGKKWIFLRRAAEEIKGEIYRYRTLSPLPSGEPPQPQRAKGKTKLRAKINQVTNWLMETEVSTVSIKEYKGDFPPYMEHASDKDDAFSDMNADRYIKFRLGDQLNFYQKKARQFEIKLKWLQWLIFILGGVGTFLAAIGVELWVPMATSLVGIFTTYLEYMQVEGNLMIYNQAKYALEGIKGWWSDLSAQQQGTFENIQKLVNSTEAVLQSELSRWIQNMVSALEKLREEETKKEEQK